MRTTLHSGHHGSEVLAKCFCLLFLSLGATAPAALLADDPEQTIEVSSAEELGQAIVSGNAFSASNGPTAETTILITGDIQLETSLPAITGKIRIKGTSLFDFLGGGQGSDFRAFTINAGGTLELDTLRIGLFAKVGNGGAILVKNGASLFLLFCGIIDNQASMNGGGIAVETGGKAEITSSTGIARNNAGGSGGGLWIGEMANLRLGKIKVKDNTAGGFGGGVSVGAGSSLVLINTTITGNEAGLDGGGLRVGPSTTTEVKSSNISNNIAKIGGAFSSGTGANSVYQDTIFDENTATSAGCTGDGPATIQGSTVSEGSTPCQFAHFDVPFGNFFLISSFLRAVHILNCTGSCTLRNNVFEQPGSQN